MAEKELTQFGVWLKKHAASRKMTMAEVARRGGLAKSTVSEALYGRPPGPHGCQAIADALRLPVRQVLIAAGHLTPKEDDWDMPGELWDLIRDLDRVDPDVRPRVIAAWKAAADILLPPDEGREGS